MFARFILSAFLGFFPLFAASHLSAADSASRRNGQNSPAGNTGQCQRTLAYLADKIPPVDDNPDLNKIRDLLLNTDVLAMLENVNNGGMSKSEAAQKMMEQAEAARQALSSNRECILQASPDAGAALIRRLENHDYSGIPTKGDVLGACVGAYIAVDWQVLANHEAALQMACYAH